MKWLLLTLSLFVSMGAFAQQDRYQFDNNKQAILFEELTKELRCPKCQNQKTADAEAVVANDLRNKVLKLFKEHKSKDKPSESTIDRTHYFEHDDPQVTPARLLL